MQYLLGPMYTLLMYTVYWIYTVATQLTLLHSGPLWHLGSEAVWWTKFNLCDFTNLHKVELSNANMTKENTLTFNAATFLLCMY